ncbi:hypothetical protein LPST_C0173 [Lactiplantibacillus plantarum ST-III]|nr:hypothetical protein LPST_C0173 [Lactiplantibacillus plantarum ST-III]
MVAFPNNATPAIATTIRPNHNAILNKNNPITIMNTQPIILKPILKITLSNHKPITKAINKPIIYALCEESFPPYKSHHGYLAS